MHLFLSFFGYLLIYRKDFGFLFNFFKVPSEELSFITITKILNIFDISLTLFKVSIIFFSSLNAGIIIVINLDLIMKKVI